MAYHIDKTSLRKAAVFAGVGLVVMTVAAVFATNILIGSLIVPGDAAATTTNIKSSDLMFRMGIFSWLVVLLSDVIVAWALYLFFIPVNKSLSLLAAWLRLLYVALLGAAIFNFIKVLLVTGGQYGEAFDPSQTAAMVMHYIRAFDHTWSFGLIVFSFHILVLGHLALKSGYVPRFFGIMLYLAFSGYFIVHCARLLVPGYENYISIVQLIFMTPMIVGEVGLGVWLLVRGGKKQPLSTLQRDE